MHQIRMLTFVLFKECSIHPRSTFYPLRHRSRKHHYTERIRTSTSDSMGHRRRIQTSRSSRRCIECLVSQTRGRESHHHSSDRTSFGKENQFHRKYQSRQHHRKYSRQIPQTRPNGAGRQSQCHRPTRRGSRPSSEMLYGRSFLARKSSQYPVLSQVHKYTHNSYQKSQF